MTVAKVTPLLSAPEEVVAPVQYSLPIGYLRAFVTLLVLAHHSALAYHTFAPPIPATLVTVPRWWQAFPVVDAHRSLALTMLVSFNDIFFMSLMFLLSGLFVWKSLERKGIGIFVKDRFVRLGIPFLIAAAIVAPLAYYPTYFLTGAGRGLAGFWHEWRALGYWPSGPAWFVSLLLAFDCVAAGLLVVWPKWGEKLAKRLKAGMTSSARLFASLVIISAAVYIPMTLVFHPLRWTTFGPFTFQTTRLLHYFAYFAAGIALGAYGLERGVLAPGGRLAQRWLLWTATALLAFGADTAAAVMVVSPGTAGVKMFVLSNLTFVISCATSTVAFLALFLRFAKRGNRVFDSLRDNAYGMYLIHYGFVSWLQYALLKSTLPAIAKFSAVFAGTILLSWGATAVLRQIPAVKRVL